MLTRHLNWKCHILITSHALACRQPRDDTN